MPSGAKFNFSCKNPHFAILEYVWSKIPQAKGPATCLRQYKVHIMPVSYVTHMTKRAKFSCSMFSTISEYVESNAEWC